MADNAPGGGAWSEQTNSFDRIYTVATTVPRPTSAADISAEAGVSENTTRAHLDCLVKIGVLLKHDRENPTTYEPDPLYTRMQSLRELLNENDHGTLRELRAELEDKIEAWHSKYNVESPELLRERINGSADSESACEIRRDANDWALTRYRLDIVKEAISIYDSLA